MPTTLFLSYARDDDEPFVARLHTDLVARGFNVWFDRVDMPSRNLTFQQEVRDAIAAGERLVLVVGPKAATSDSVRQEWQFAWFEADKVVTPILRKGDYPVVPDELRLLHCEDFRNDAEYAFHLDQLVRILRDPPPTLGKLFAVPSLPAHFLLPSKGLPKLRDALRSDLDLPVVISGAAAKVGLHGMGGIGKSVLAAALARDRKVRESFPDGIVWIGLGAKPDLRTRMQDVHHALGGDIPIATEHEGKDQLKGLLREKAVLLVIDDVWRRDDVDAFDVLGSRCRALITTRDAGLLTSLGGVHHLVELLTDAEAIRLLAVAAGIDPDALPGEAHEVLTECGRLPLAVALAGGMVRAGTPWCDLRDALREHELEFLEDPHAANEQHVNLWRTIEVSVQALTGDVQQRLAELAVFPEDEQVPEVAVITLWQHSGNLSPRQSRKLLVDLKQRSLVQLARSVETGTDGVGKILLHDLVHDYCVRCARKSLDSDAELHLRMVNAYRSVAPKGLSAGPDDGYFLRHIAWHIQKAGLTDDLYNLLGDEAFRQRSVRAASGAYALSEDIQLALDAAMENRDLSRIAQFGFLVCDCREGRFATRDVLAIHSQDRDAARREVGLLQKSARFRLLVLMALAEVKVGDKRYADEFLNQAAMISGVQLGEGEDRFLADTVLHLHKAGCTAPQRLLRTVLPPERSALEAGRIAPEFDPGAQAVVIADALAWFRQGNLFPVKYEKGTLVVDAFRAVASAAVKMPASVQRENLLGQIREVIEIIPSMETGKADKHPQFIPLVIAWVAFMNRPFTEILETRTSLRSILGELLVNNACPVDGYALLEQAVEACGNLIFSGTSGQVAKSLRSAWSSQAADLFTRLLENTKGEHRGDHLSSVLAALAEGPAAGLQNLVWQILPFVNALGIIDRSRISKLYHRVYVQAGWSEVGRPTTKTYLNLFTHIPWLTPGARLHLADTVLDEAHRVGKTRMYHNEAWLTRIARWLSTLDTQSEQTQWLEKLLKPSGPKATHEVALWYLALARRLPAEPLRATTLRLVLDVVEKLTTNQRDSSRQEVLALAEAIVDEESRRSVLRCWLKTAVGEEMAAVRKLHGTVKQAVGLSAAGQSDLLGSIASAYSRCGSDADARVAWHDAAWAEQEDETLRPAFAARSAAIARLEDSQAWQAVLQGLSNPDPETVMDLLGTVADAVHSTERLAELESRVRQLSWHDCHAEWLLRARLALAWGWARVEEPARGAALALWALRRFSASQKSLPHTAMGEVADFVKILLPGWTGRILLRELLDNERNHDDSERISILTSLLTDFPDSTCAAASFRWLYGQVLAKEARSHFRWESVAERAVLASALAKLGQIDAAGDAARSIPIPNSLGKDDLDLVGGNDIRAVKAIARLAELRETLQRIDQEHGSQPWRGIVETKLQQTIARATEDHPEIFKPLSYDNRQQDQALTTAVELDPMDFVEAMARDIIATDVIGPQFVGRWASLKMLAKAKANFGAVDAALRLAQDITHERRHDELLAELAEMLSKRNPQLAIPSWQQCATAEGRRHTARSIARWLSRSAVLPRSLHGFPIKSGQEGQALVLPPNRVPSGRLQRWSKPSGDYRDLRLVILALLSYCSVLFIFTAEWQALKGLLVGPNWRIWSVAATAAGITAFSISYSLARHHVKGVARKLLCGLLFVPVLILPGLGVFWLAMSLRKFGRSFLLWQVNFLKSLVRWRPPLRAASQTGTAAVEPWIPPLRAVARDSLSFDLLLASLISQAAPYSELPAILSRLPPFRLPRSASQESQQEQESETEWKRNHHFLAVSTRAVQRWATRLTLIGISMFVEMPIIWISKLRRR